MSTNRILSVIGLNAALAGAALAQSAPSSPQVAWNFDKDEAGKRAEEWMVRMTNPDGSLAKWKVAADPTAPSRPNVMKLLETPAHGSTYNLLVNDDTSYKDLDLAVKVKANGGKEDQGGGLIWRCVDQDNYYICRMNPLENNYRVYKVVEGKRTQLDSANVDLKSDQWYTLRVQMVGDTTVCFLDGKKLLSAKDDTFKKAGTIGFWTKADAASSFDDLSVKPSTERLEIAKPADAGK